MGDSYGDEWVHYIYDLPSSLRRDHDGLQDRQVFAGWGDVSCSEFELGVGGRCLESSLHSLGIPKIPRAAVELSMLLEDDFRKMEEMIVLIKPEFAGHLEKRLEGMRTLTNFLRSGRLL